MEQKSLQGELDTLSERHTYIYERIQRDGYVRVPELSESLNVSDITIRRDLAYLEKRNLVERTHGGAVSIHRIYKEINYSLRSDVERENKDAIARYAASLINDGDTVFINGGSTTFHIFRYIDRKHVKIVTTNAGCLTQVINPDIELILAGGLYHHQSNAFYGGFTNDILHKVNANKAILGVHGISCHYGLTTPMHYAAETSRIMIDRTRGDVIVIADHRKIGAVSDYVTAPVERIDTLVTDEFPDPDYVRDFQDLGIQVVQTNRI